MKTLWNALALVAIVNLLGLIGFGGWLVSSGRLNADRLREARQRLAITVAQEQAKAEEAKIVAEQEAAKEKERARFRLPAVTAEEAIDERAAAQRADEARLARARREVDDLARSLAEQRAALEADRAAFARERETIARAGEQRERLVADERFRRTLSVLHGLKPADARSVLGQIIDGVGTPPAPAGAGAGSDAGARGDGVGEGALVATGPGPAANGAAVVAAPEQPPMGEGESGMDRAVEYLGAMQERARTRVMAEFVKQDPRLAAELLERLRGRAPAGGARASAQR